MKNVADVLFGGLAYWLVGYGLSFGKAWKGFVGLSHFLVTAKEGADGFGTLYVSYTFHFSFASAATTIMSGAAAERLTLRSYVAFSLLSVPVYALTACWAWNADGFLARLGFHDFAGGCVVHMGGGASALAAAVFLGPRVGRFSPGHNHHLPSPVTAITGTLLLWWAWLSFNAGSTFHFGGRAWLTAAKACVVTLQGSIGGGVLAFLWNWAPWHQRPRYVSVGDVCTGILGGLVGVTGCCAVVTPGEGLAIGVLAAAAALASERLLVRLKVDDPVASVPVHYVGGVVGTLATGVFGQRHLGQLTEDQGLLHGGRWRLLGVQALAIVVISVWWLVWTFVLFQLLEWILGARVNEDDQHTGSDFNEHGIGEPAGRRASRAKVEAQQRPRAARRRVGFATEKALRSLKPNSALAKAAVLKVLESVAQEAWFSERVKSEVVRGTCGETLPVSRPLRSSPACNSAHVKVEDVEEEPATPPLSPLRRRMTMGLIGIDPHAFHHQEEEEEDGFG